MKELDPPSGPVTTVEVTQAEIALIAAHRESQKIKRNTTIKAINDSLSARISGRGSAWSGWMGTLTLATVAYQALVDNGYITE